MTVAHYETLFERHAANPILTAADWPYPAHTVFNAGATLLADGTTLLLCRVEDRRDIHTSARPDRPTASTAGSSTLSPEPDRYPEELWGIEDPRITFIEELDKYVIAYTAFSPGGQTPGSAQSHAGRPAGSV